MSRLELLCKQDLQQRGRKYQTLKRIKIGKAIAVIAALPLMTSWMFIIAVPMMLPIKPSVWAKSKIIAFKEWRRLR